jgi:NitT/TauT family transport system permease protein
VTWCSRKSGVKERVRHTELVDIGKRMNKLRRLTARSLEIGIPIIVLLVLWQAIVWFRFLPSFLVPPPLAVFKVMVARWDLLLQHTAVTALEVSLGFILATVIGIPLGWLIVSSRALERTIYPLMVGSQAVPKVALGPLFVLAFGYGILPKVVLALLVAFFPIAAGAAVGFSSLDAGWFLLTRSMRASRLQTFLKLQIPAGLPSIFGGLKVGAALAVVGAVVGEFIGSDAGLSYLLLIANSNRDTATEFACLILLSLLGILFYAMVGWAESIAVPWRNPEEMRWSAQGTP